MNFKMTKYVVSRVESLSGGQFKYKGEQVTCLLTKPVFTLQGGIAEKITVSSFKYLLFLLDY